MRCRFPPGLRRQQPRKQADPRRLFRHPSYVGFFTWAVGTQVLLANPIAALAFSVKLHSFFSSRIVAEEHTLRAFFGRAYLEYASRTPPCAVM